jgi:Domain of unknown function DUF29
MAERKTIILAGREAASGTGLVSAKPVFIEPMQQGPAINRADDFHGWLLDQASALRERRHFSLDWDNLAEELEAMAADQRRQIRTQLTKLLLHLLKLKTQPDEMHLHGSWRASIREARTISRISLKSLLESSKARLRKC